ncbi:hypothetical protein ACW4TU_06945 [Streptomyces sp. QTS52]
MRCNAYAQTAVAPYSVRAEPGGTRGRPRRLGPAGRPGPDRPSLTGRGRGRTGAYPLVGRTAAALAGAGSARRRLEATG